MASDARPRSPQDVARRRRDFSRSPYVTLGAVRYAVRRAPPPRACPCRCCSEEAVAACLGRAKPDRRTLDRFGRNLGRGGREEQRPSRQKRLRDLTERLLRAHTTPPHTPPPPPPPPPPPHSAPVLPPVPPPRSRHRHSPPRGVSVDRYDDFDANNITLVRVEPRSIVGSYAQKTIPYRSASFSQGDFAPDKYYRGTNRQPSVFDFGKRILKTDAERLHPSSNRDNESTSATEENVTEGGSVASVDSAVGSDEGLLAHASPAPRSPPPDAPHKQLGARSLTHPLPRRVPPVREEGPGEASGSLPALIAPRVLHELREESDGSQADSAQAHSEGTSPLEPAQPFTFPPLPAPPSNTCANVDCECVNFPVSRDDSASAIASSIPVPVYECIVKQWSSELPQEEPQKSDATSDGSLDRDKEDEIITSEQVAHILAAVKNPSTPAPIAARERRRPLDKTKRRKGIYITTASDDGGEEEMPPLNGCKRENSDASLQEIRLSAETRTSSLLGDKSDDSCTNGPPSPCEALMWPRSEELRTRRARFSQQSSDEREEDAYRARRKYGVTSRGDSPSEAESDSCSRDRTASPSPYSPSDASDVEAKRQQFTRVPFGRTLEAPTSRSVEVGRRSLSDATVPSRKTSATTIVGTRSRGPTHVRATSSPSKLVGVKPDVDLLAELLRGSSEALSNSSTFDNVVLTLHQHNINDSRVVTGVKCNCVYNQSGKCKHVAAIICYINNKVSLSKTSNEQQWGKPSIRQFVQSKYSKGRYFQDMFPPVSKTECCQTQPITHNELLQESSLKQVLVASVQTQDISLITDVISEMLDRVESLIEREDCSACLIFFNKNRSEFELYHSDYTLEENLNVYYEKHVVVTEEDIIHTCCSTIKQSACLNWYAIRHVRITASKNIHSIKTRKTKTIPSLVSSILNPKKVDCAATRYGLRNEQKALLHYEKLNFCQVKKVGAIISKDQPWLCASIDGVVVEDGCVTKLVEVKCPISCEKKPVVDFDNHLCNVVYLEFRNNFIEVKQSHPYYTQVQSQMYITGMTVCDLFVYSPINASVTVQVNRNEQFIQEIILKSEYFYFMYYLPALYTEYMHNNSDCDDFQKRSFTGKDILNLF